MWLIKTFIKLLDSLLVDYYADAELKNQKENS